MVATLLVVIMLVALAGARGTLMEERMSANSRDRGMAFQAAEAALVAGEALLLEAIPVMPATGCEAGLCAGLPADATKQVWEYEDNWDNAGTVDDDLGGAKYLIELLADNVVSTDACVVALGDPDAPPCSGAGRRYRITARSIAANRAEVMLQSIYVVQ
jgi:type IV pilus assembly protein PilX